MTGFFRRLTISSQNHNSFSSCPAISAVIGLVATLLLSGAAARSQELPPKLQAAIFLKVLSYDDSIAAMPGSQLTIYVVTDRKTEGTKAAVLDGLTALTSKKMGGKGVLVKSVGIEQLESVAQGAVILYVPADADEKTAKKVISVAGQKKLPTLGGSEALARLGVAVGLKLGDQGKPEIIINLKSSKAQGMKLSSRVLGLATVLK